MKANLLIASLVALLLPVAVFPSETVPVFAKGIGVSPEKAERAAFRAAVEKVVGTLVDAKTLVENDDLVEDRILSFSNGFVETFEAVEGPAKNEDGLFEVKIRATVRRDRLSDEVKTLVKDSAEIDGGGLFAELLTRRDAMEDAKAMAERLFENVPAKLLVAEIATKADGKADVKLDAGTGRVTVDVSVRIDPKAYADWTDSLGRFLDKVAESKAAWKGKGALCGLRNQYCLVVPKKPSDFSFDLFYIDLSPSGYGYEAGSFDSFSYTFADDMVPIRDYMAESSASKVVFRVSVLDSSGRALVRKTETVDFLDEAGRGPVPVVRTSKGIVPGWYSWWSGAVGPGTKTTTVDLGRFTAEDLRAAARFNCEIVSEP